jgi:hypothetical protein
MNQKEDQVSRRLRLDGLDGTIQPAPRSVLSRISLVTAFEAMVLTQV